MMNKLFFTALAVVAFSSVQAEESKKLTFVADRIAVDNVTGAATATGHVIAVEAPVTMRSEYLTRDIEGVYHFHDPTCVTTCTNEVGHTHWNVTGDVEYKGDHYAILRNMWVNFYELPILWLPYFYYPLDGECALRVMPGYMSRWGAYVMTKYVYDIAGDTKHQDNTWWMHGNTRFDLRYVNGIAFGQTLYWNLGDFGRGKFKIYYAWDENYDEYEYHGGLNERNWGNWGSQVNRDRYAIELSHNWEPTERDIVRLKGSIFSDSFFRDDFFRENFFSIKNQWLGYEGNEVSWEHAESIYSYGASVSGSLNDFYGATAQLPEIYFDIAPQPIFDWLVNYESENRIGYLSRRFAEYGSGDKTNPFAFNPGYWADYGSFRFDSYHRFTAPMKTCDDVLSIVPRVAYRATGWNHTGEADLSGWDEAKRSCSMFRSIFEGGVTFASRGAGWIDDVWQHVVEPYFDVLAQKAFYAGESNGNRPYVFDSYDSSRMWEDQFAGRSRNLPYSYCGITPGVRNAWNYADEKGYVSQILDLDVYAAMQFNKAEYLGGDDFHRLAYADSPNYGKNNCYVMPGARMRWTPARDISFVGRAEYDPDYNRLAYADFGWKHEVSKDFSYYIKYAIRDHRWWDFSSTPYDPARMESDELNWAKFNTVDVGFTQHPIDWFAWSPFIRWDCHAGELDEVGAWFDYLTDCLGFRLLISYDNEYTRIDGYRRDDDWNIGFYIYLRAFGSGANPF